MELLSSSICRSCRLRLGNKPYNPKLAIRSFATTRSCQIVPPESPHYIDVPESHQPYPVKPKHQKGILPVPRDLFPAKRPDKPSSTYLDNVTQDLKPQNQITDSQLSNVGRFRRRAAEQRKRHLREGLTELYTRQQQTTAKMEYRSKARQTERARLIAQPDREDSRLTSTSTPTVMLPNVKSATPIADDLAAAKRIYEQKQANYLKSTTTKTEERMDSLHTLYMSARTFITTPEQLDEAIAAQFDDPDIFRNDVENGRSVWSKGPPDTVKAMIANYRGAGDGVDLADRIGRRDGQAVEVRFQRGQERFKKIAEKLSGGKI